LVAWAYAHTFQSYGSEEKESTTPAFMGPLAMQHGGSRVVAPPDGEEAPHQTLQEEVPHAVRSIFFFCFVLWCFQHHQGFAFFDHLHLPSSGDTFLSFAFGAFVLSLAFDFSVSAWGVAAFRLSNFCLPDSPLSVRLGGGEFPADRIGRASVICARFRLTTRTETVATRFLHLLTPTVIRGGVSEFLASARML
jgi:hypothetical protein